jgi:cytochrome c oxidase subunit 3
MKKDLLLKNTRHPFHIVEPSSYPFTISICIFFLVISFVAYLQNNYAFSIVGFLALVGLIKTIYNWFFIIINEAYYGYHTNKVQNGLRMGMVLFIVSEVMFFFGFFWAFFHASLTPSIYIGAIWPPINIDPLITWGLPLLNTIILLSSGISITWAHRNIIKGNWETVTNSLKITIFLGIVFTFFQICEYIAAPFFVLSSIYGSIFFLTTGFHGFHVLIGTIFLIVCLVRNENRQFTTAHHIGFEAATWYWHFVDVVWIFLFIMIYWWGA